MLMARLPRIAGRMIDRDQVLHVARLALLKLTDEEVERMSSELSAVLDHIENISQLDLDGVEPTSHVVELENVLRDDVPRPCWPRDTILELAPDATDEGFRVPSPGQ
jgi:aspartyl-tRNA(Asn)/glutamyl-tRNA(Gln) amidotransferase subunit C